MGKTLKEVREYIGDWNQMISVQEATLNGGFQEGVKVVEVHNGGNLSATVLPGRCMDLYQVRYKGKNMNYLAPCKIVAPEYYDARGAAWLRNFFVGMTSTLGLQHIGQACVLESGQEVGLHGRIANAPAEDVRCSRGVKGETPTLTLEGTMREAMMFGENLTLHRELAFTYEEDSIVMTDTITNHGFGDRQFLYGLHLNYGYPLLEEGVKLILDTEKVTPATQDAADKFESWQEIEAPSYPCPERCYYHKLKKDENGMVQYTLFNEKRGIGVNVQYDGNELPYFIEWKMLNKEEYVLGLEPFNVDPTGPKLNEKGCGAPILGAGESKTYTIRFRFIDKL